MTETNTTDKISAQEPSSLPVQKKDEAELLKDAADKLDKLEKIFGKSKDTALSAVNPYDVSDIDPLFSSLYMHEPFLGTVSAGITKVVDLKVPTAYVGVRPNGKSYEIIMGFNPKFLRMWNQAKQQGVIKHELYHTILNHIFSRSVGEKSYAELHNWATDLAINSLIGEKNLPEMTLLPGRQPIDPKTGKPIVNKYAEYIANAPLNQASEFYFEDLRRIQDEMNDSDGSVAATCGIGTLDDHGGWDDIPKEVKDEIKEKIKDLIHKGAERAERSQNWGTMPAEVQEYIKRYLSKTIDWKSILKNFIGRVRSYERNSTIRKINKKMPYIYPGVKRPLKATFACFIDQSGSMADKDIAMLFSELEGLANETEIDVYHFDTEIDEESHMTWKRGMAHPKCLRTRCGGTDFQSVADFCNNPKKRKSKWSGVIILTDGYAPKMGVINGAKVLWVITETGTMEAVRPSDLAIQMKKEKKFKEYLSAFTKK